MELLFDDKWIDRTAGVRRVLGQPRKEPAPVLRADRPWESEGIHGLNALFWDAQEQVLKLWYRASAPGGSPHVSPPAKGIETSERGEPDRQHFLCYAESQDGVTWVKPGLGLVEFRGRKDNNILRAIGGQSIVFENVQKDPSDPDPGKRYKAFGFEHNPTSVLPLRGTHSHGVCVTYSPDGLDWRVGPKLVMSTTEMTDADVLFPGRDPHTGKWVAFMRPRLHPKRRFIGLSESDDFEHWTYPHMVLTPDEHDSEFIEFYGLTATYVEPYYVGILWVFHNNPLASPMTNELVYSRDGRHWERAMPGEQFLSLGPTGAFDSRMIVVIGIVPWEGDLLLFYNGANHEHGSDRGQPMSKGEAGPGEKPQRAIGLARIRKGMFCGYAADHEGMIETKYVTNYGGPGPRVLASVARGGGLRAEILDHYGNVLPGWERERCQMVHHSDGTIGFAWGEGRLEGRLDQESPEGGRVQRVVKLRLYLQRATVFGFSIGEAT